MRIVDCDYFVVGSGMSGLMTALHLASAGRTVLVTKSTSPYAARWSALMSPAMPDPTMK